MSYKFIEAETLIGKVIKSINQIDSGTMEIDTEDGKKYRFLHNQDCCENVAIHDIRGDLQSLVGKQLLEASKVSDSVWPADVAEPGYNESFTWTEIMLATRDNIVSIRWLGTSNGYYGEGVDLEEIE